MAGVDALLDLDDPGLSSSVHYVGGGGNGLVSGGGHGDIFDTGAFDDFNTESTGYKSSSSQLYHDDFDPFSAPNANSDLYRPKVEHEPQLLPSAVVAADPNGGQDGDQFADLLGDFGSSAVDEPCDDQLNNPKQSDDDQPAVDNDTSFYDGQHPDQRTENMTEVELINNNADHQRYTTNGNLDADHELNNGFRSSKTSTFTWTQLEAPGDERHSDPIEVVNRHQRDQVEMISDDRPYQRKFEPEMTGRGVEGPSETKRASVGRTGSTSIRRNQSRERRQQEQSSRTPQDENACHQCGKRVYQMERITADEIVYHKTCFRCAHCNRVLSLLNYSAIDGQMYCKPHFLEMFKTKGNYEDGFRAAGSRPTENGGVQSPENEDYHAVVATTNSHNDTSSWRDSHADGAADNRPQEEIPAVPLKQVRNIFENLVQQSSSQQVMPPQPSRPVRERSVERGWTSAEQPATVSKSRSSDAVVPDGGATVDREVVQCSSTTCIIEDELPPPAMTRSILAKFRELESSVGDGKSAVPLPVTRSASMSLSSRNTARPVRNDVVRSSTSSSLGHSDDSRTVRGAGSNDDVDYAGTNGLSDVQSGTETDELPQQGTARSLLARWRTIEESSRGDEREETTRKSSPAKRSQSTSRVEGRQRPRVVRRNNSGEDGEDRVADYLDVQNTSEFQSTIADDERPPHLMTQQVLAKFRSMESEFRVAAEREQPRLQRSRSFRWEVKEAVPLSRGNIMVHGDTPKRSISQYDGFGQDATSDNEAIPAASPAFREDELPAPATTRNLLSLFKSMEDPAAAPPTPATVERNLSLARSESRSRSYHHSVGSRPTSEFDTDYQATGSRLNDDGYDTVAPDAGEFENEPVFDPNLVRESDRNDMAELPERGTTRGLLAKFRSMQQEN